MMRATTLAALGFVWFIPAFAAAQQPAAPPPPPPPPREITAELSFVGTSGNSSTKSLGVGGGVILRPERWEITNKIAFVRAEDEGDTTAESLAAQSKAQYALTTRLSVYGQYIFFRDEFAGVEQRHHIDGGLSYLLIDAAPHRLAVTGGIGYANEQRIPPPDLSSGIVPIGALYNYRWSDTALVTNDFRAVFSLADSEDRRLTNILSLTAKLTTQFSLKVSNTIRFVNAPPVGIEKTDTTTAIALVATFL